jgi:hypothetical protein
MTYVHPATLLEEIVNEHPDADDQALLVMLINKLRELDDLRCWLDVSRAWFGHQRAGLKRADLSPEERATRKRVEDAAIREGADELKAILIKRFLSMTPEQQEEILKKKNVQ